MRFIRREYGFYIAISRVCKAVFNRGILIAFLISVLCGSQQSTKDINCYISILPRLMALAGIKSRLMSVSCFSLIRQQLVGWFCIETATDGAVMLIKRDELWNLKIMPVGNGRSGEGLRGDLSNFR